MKKSSRPMKTVGFLLLAGLMGTAAGFAIAKSAQAASLKGRADAGVEAAAGDALTLASAEGKKAVKGKEGAGATNGAEKFIEKMATDAIDFLGSDMSQEQKKAAFRKLLEQSFDMNTIGRFTLGTYWRQATPEQQKEYQTLFKRRVVNIYSQRFQEYDGQKFETRGSRKEDEKDTIVTSYIISPDGGAEVKVDWRVRNKNGKYSIVDVIVEGVSMSVTQRSDFASVIQRGGGKVEVLLEHLRGNKSAG